MSNVVVLSGMSGSGKSTYARKRTEGVTSVAKIISTDDYFTTPEGVYAFDPAKIGVAHAATFYRFIQALDSGRYRLIVVDNTNTTIEEISPYMLGAAAFGYEAEVVTIEAPMIFAHMRNTHDVSANEVEAQMYRLRMRALPPYWKSSVVRYEPNDEQFYPLRPGVITPDTDPLRGTGA